MYTKVFRQIYDGTLADNWQALVTFQQLLILADENGMVDMTVAAIHRITGIPTEILQQGIAILEAPDHGSRTPDMEGRRISRVDQHRDWGWFLVNFKKYRQLQTRDEKKEADKLRMQQRRAEEKAKEISTVATCSETSQTVAACSGSSKVSQNVADVAHTDTETDTEEEQELESPNGDLSPPPAAPPSGDLLGTDDPDPPGVPPCPVKRIIAAYHVALPALAHVRAFPDASARMLKARWREDPKRQNIEWWERFFAYVGRCPFLVGGKTDFAADLMWLVRPTNFAKVINGNYDERAA